MLFGSISQKPPNVEFKGLLLSEALLLTPEATLQKPKAQFDNCSVEGQEGILSSEVSFLWNTSPPTF